MIKRKWDDPGLKEALLGVGDGLERFMKAKREECSTCGGHGIVTNTFTGEPDDCPECGLAGTILVAVRDRRGRFLPERKDKKS